MMIATDHLLSIVVGLLLVHLAVRLLDQLVAGVVFLHTIN